MDIHHIRLVNLQQAIKKAGSQARLADMVGIKSAYISQIKNTKHPTNMGNDVARRIESALGLPHGWMDVLHDNEAMRVINGDPMLPPKEVGQYNLTIDEIKELLTNKQLIAYQGRYKNILSAEEEGRIDETDKLLLAALDQKYKR